MMASGDRATEPYYVVAHSAPSLEHSRVLRQGDAFALLDPFGDVPGQDITSAFGLFHAGTRHLSRSWMTFSGKRLLLLGSHVNIESGVLRVEMTNADLLRGEKVAIPRESMHLERSAFLWQGCLYESIRTRNYCAETIRFVLQLEFAADFADVFEVRGVRRNRRGEMLPAKVSDREMLFQYRGVDEQIRSTRIAFDLPPTRIAPGAAEFNMALPPGETFACEIAIACGNVKEAPTPLARIDAWQARGRARENLVARDCRIVTDNKFFNRWIGQSLADIRMMLTETSAGLYPFAGVPWFNTEFGRDAIITALELLWLEPEIARGVLTFLASKQAMDADQSRVAQPGKIVHEIRRGEMADLGEIPFGRYYGSVDATPLFVMLAGAYLERTNDLATLRSLWPAIGRCLHWIDYYGDADRDGFVEYSPHANGLRNQGWKDAADSIFHQDGALAEGPIALCEVQGYVYAAKLGAARVARALGHTDAAGSLERQAALLRTRFHERYWSGQLNTFVIALDGRKQPCEVASSNALQCLFTGIVEPEAAAKMTARAFESDFFSGWGVRTLAEGQPRYNPMSYHNGSVWPHDNALIAWGLSKYGFAAQAAQILAALHDISTFLPLGRLPELICGFQRRPDGGPTLYPVACSPQAWASGAVFLALQATLGLSVEPAQRRISFVHPLVPAFLGVIRLSNLKVVDAEIDLTLSAGQERYVDAAVAVTRRVGDVHCVTTS